MTNQKHYRALETMYLGAPINALYQPRLEISEAACTIRIDVHEGLFHAAGAVHGSVYFKMLDDAAFFAANSLESEVFVLTTSFTTYLTRPVSAGTITSEGRVVNRNRSQWIAESVLYDDQRREIGRGNGIFVRSRMLLADTPGYGT